MSKKIVYIDMDGVLVDLQSAIDRLDPQVRAAAVEDIDEVPHLFANPDPMPGAINAFNRICKKYDVYILSTAPWGNPTAWSDKRLWVERHLGENAFKRLILSHNKHLCHGDYLIDDRLKNGAEKFTGEHIHFGTDKFNNWDTVLKYLEA